MNDGIERVDLPVCSSSLSNRSPRSITFSIFCCMIPTTSFTCAWTFLALSSFCSALKRYYKK